MSSPTKFWLGFFTFLPLILLLLFFGLFFTIFFENIIALDQNHGEFPIEFIQSLFWFILLIILMAVTALAVKIYYMVHTANNPKNDSNKKLMWILILIFTGSVGAIVYYFLEIIPLQKEE